MSSRSLFLDVAATAGRLIAVGERGHVIISEDAENWRQVPAPTRATLTSVACRAHRCLAAGHDATILETDDAGQSWSISFSSPTLEAPFLDVLWIDDRRAMAIGGYGLAFETADGARTWARRRIDPDEDNHLNAIAARGDAVLLVGESGSAYLSVNRGRSFKRLATPYAGSFFGALSVGAKGWLIFGLRGHAYLTENDGRAWRSCETGTQATLQGGAVLPDGRIVLVGLEGTLLTSSDAARGFAGRTLETRRASSSVVATPTGLAVVGERGVRTLPFDGGGPGLGRWK